MQYLNLSRLDNTLKNKVLWPDGWMKWHESPAVWILRMAKFHVTLAKEKFCIMNLIAGGSSHVYNLFSDSTWTPSPRRCSSLFIPSALFFMYCSVWTIQLESKLFWWIQMHFYISLPLVYHDVQEQWAADLYLACFDILHYLHKPMGFLNVIPR